MALPRDWSDEDTDMEVLGAGALTYAWWRESEYLPDGSGVRLTVDDPDGDGTVDVEVTWSKMREVTTEILEGKHAVARYLVEYIKDDDIDADAADVILQVCCLGRIVYS